MPPGRHMAPAVRAATEAVITTTGITRGAKRRGQKGPAAGMSALCLGRHGVVPEAFLGDGRVRPF